MGRGHLPSCTYRRNLIIVIDSRQRSSLKNILGKKTNYSISRAINKKNVDMLFFHLKSILCAVYSSVSNAQAVQQHFFQHSHTAVQTRNCSVLVFSQIDGVYYFGGLFSFLSSQRLYLVSKPLLKGFFFQKKMVGARFWWGEGGIARGAGRSEKSHLSAITNTSSKKREKMPLLDHPQDLSHLERKNMKFSIKVFLK